MNDTMPGNMDQQRTLAAGLAAGLVSFLASFTGPEGPRRVLTIP